MLLSGSLVGKKYALTRQIGEGAMGVVWAAVNQDTGGEVALKLILRSTDELKHRLQREARACGALRRDPAEDEWPLVRGVVQALGNDPFFS